MKHQKQEGKLHAIRLDVTSDESVNRAFDYVKSVLRDKGRSVNLNYSQYSAIVESCPLLGLHGLVNNAGIAGQNAWDDWMSLDSYRMCWEVNTLGLIRMTHSFKPLIKKARFPR